MTTLTLDLTSHVYVDREGYLRDESGETLLNSPYVAGESDIADAMLANGGQLISVRLVIDIG